MNQMNPMNGYPPIFFNTSVESRRLFSHSLGSHRHSQQPNRWFERNVGMSSDQAMISHQGIRPPPRLLQTQTTSTVVVNAQEAYTPYNTVTVQKSVQRLDTPPHVDSPGSYASTSSDQEVPHYLNTNGVSSMPRAKHNVARLAQQRMALTGNEEGPTVRQHLQQQQAASKLLANASTREPNPQSPGANGPFTEPSMPPAPPRRQRSKNNGRAKNQTIAQQLSMPVQPIVRVGVPPPTTIPTTSASPPTVGGQQALYANHVQHYQNHYQNAPSPNRQQVVPRQRPSAPTPAHPQNVQIVVGPRPSPINDPEMGQRFQVARPNSQGYLPPQNQQYRVKIQQLEKGEELDTQRIYGARQQPHPSQIQRPSAPVPPSPNNEENRFRYNSGDSSKSSYDEYNEIVPQVSNPYQSVESGAPSSSLPQSSQHYNLQESLSNNNHSYPRLMVNQPNASNHHQVLFQQQNSISSQPGPPTCHSSFSSSSSQPSQSQSDLQPSDPPIGNHLAVQQALRKRVKDRRKKENEPSDDTDISDNQNISMELPEETFDNFNLSGGDLDDVDDDFLQIFAADEEREFHPVSTNPMDLDKELGLLSEEGLDISGDLLQQLCGTDQITLSKELFDEFVETFQAEESEEKTKDRPVSRQTARTQQELQQQHQHQQQQLQRHHLMQQQLRQQQLGVDQLTQAQAAHLQRQHSQQQLKQLLQQRNPEDAHPTQQIQNQQLARIQAFRQAQIRPNTPLDPYSQQQLEAHRSREREDMYRRKSRFIRRSINALVYENAALCDEVGRLNQRIQTVVEERKSLAKRLNHFEKNHLRRLNTAKKKKEEAARQREQNLATLEAERTKEQIKAAATAAAAAAVANSVAQEEMLHRERSLDEMIPSPKKRPRSSLPSPRSSSTRKRISEEQISQEVNVLLQGIKADQQSRVSARMAQGSPIKLPATVVRRDSFRREPFNRLTVASSSDIPVTTPLSISPASDSSIVLPPMLNGENSPGIPRNLSAPLLVQKSPVKYSQSMLRVNEVKEEPESPHDSPQRNPLLEKKRERRPKARKNGEEDGIKIEFDSSETPSPRETSEHKLNLDNLSDQTSRDGDRMLRKRRFTATPEVPEMPGAKRRRTTRGSSLATNEDEAEFPRDLKREDDDREDPEVADILREVRRRRREMSRDTSESRSIRSTPAPDTPDTPSTDERSRRSSRTRPPRVLVSSSPTPIPPTPPPESLKDSSETRSLRLRDRKMPSSDLTPQPKTTRTNLERAVKRKS